MSYGQDLGGAARRHLKAGAKLYAEQNPGEKQGCRAVSGYLFGLAGELAVKQMMSKTGMRPKLTDKRNDPFYAHFPSLRTMLADSAHGRLQGVLKQVVESKVFDNWSTDIRYAAAKEIDDRWIAKWKEQATSLVDKMGDL